MFAGTRYLDAAKRKILIVNTKDSVDQNGETFSFSLANTQYAQDNIVKIGVKSMSLKHEFYNVVNSGDVVSDNNGLWWRFTGIPGIWYWITMDSGWYVVNDPSQPTNDDFQNMFDIASQASAPGTSFIGIEPLAGTGKFVCYTLGSGDTITIAGTDHDPSDFPDNKNNGLARIIGIGKEDFEAPLYAGLPQFNTLLPDQYQLQGPQLAYVYADELSNGQGVFSDKTVRPLLDVIPLTSTPFGGTAWISHNDDDIHSVVFPSPRQLSYFRMRLRDEFDKPLYLGSNSVCVLHLMLYSV
jgi:hypothetical protein